MLIQGASQWSRGVRTAEWEVTMSRSKKAFSVAMAFAATCLAMPWHAAADGVQFTPWSAPVHLGDVVNSSAQDFSPTLSPDGLSLYFCSDRPDGFGEFDIWVSRRDCEQCPWGAPVPLGPNVNSPGTEISSAFSPDGHLLFFASDRGGDVDIWVSHRRDRHDDFGWGPPVNLGPDVNTTAEEVDPAFLPGKGLYGGHTLYFVRSDGTATGDQDIYQTSVSRHGVPRGPAVPVTEINSVGRLDGSPSLRKDGREIVFWSNRSGGLGGADVWSATRPHAKAPWSPPVNLGAPVNTNFAEITLGMTFDGTQLFVAKGQQLGGLGLRDLWMSTRECIDDVEEAAAANDN